jgi:hypothetical protein
MTLDQLLSRIKNLKIKSSKKALADIGKTLVKEIKIRTIDGYGVNSSGQAENFKRLKEDTIKARKRNKKLDSRTSPETSNQIESGGFVDSIKSQVTDNTIEIKPSDKLQGLAKGQEKMGRTIFKLEEDQIEKIKEQVKADIVAEILKSLKR